MIHKQTPTPYYIVGPVDHRSEISLTVLVFAGIAVGIFLGACMWARSTARGVEVVAPVSICERCGRVIDGSSHECEEER